MPQKKNEIFADILLYFKGHLEQKTWDEIRICFDKLLKDIFTSFVFQKDIEKLGDVGIDYIAAANNVNIAVKNQHTADFIASNEKIFQTALLLIEAISRLEGNSELKQQLADVEESLDAFNTHVLMIILLHKKVHK